jgi:hypothetical protein
MLSTPVADDIPATTMPPSGHAPCDDRHRGPGLSTGDTEDYVISFAQRIVIDWARLGQDWAATPIPRHPWPLNSLTFEATLLSATPSLLLGVFL